MLVLSPKCLSQDHIRCDCLVDAGCWQSVRIFMLQEQRVSLKLKRSFIGHW